MFKYGGYHGRMLRVDLTRQTSRTEDLPAEYVERFVGGRGLGARLLWDEVRPGVDALGEGNKLIFTAGPLVGTGAPASARFCVTTLSPLTDIYLFSICGGNLGPYLKSAGVDVLIVEGKSPRPTYLVLTETGVEFRDATPLHYVDARRTQELVAAEIDAPHVAVASIGPAGENLVRFACILSGSRAAGRGGAGAVMGSKNLKAIAAVRGSAVAPLHDADALRQAILAAGQAIRDTPSLREGFGKYGTALTAQSARTFGMLPWNNWQTVAGDDSDGLMPEVMRRLVIKDLACPTCPVACGKLTRIPSGDWAGAESEGPEYETIYSLGSNLGITDFAPIVRADALCDELGLDTMSAGVVLSFAAECCERGLLPEAVCHDQDVRFGQARALVDLLPQIAFRQGVGDLLAEGVRRTAERIGGGASDFAMHAKGMELGGYDPRALKAQAIVYACGPRGGCHHAAGYVVSEELASGRNDLLEETGKSQVVKHARNSRVVADCGIYCTFMGRAVKLNHPAAMLSAATGLPTTEDWLTDVGSAVSDVERAYTVRLGLGRADDTLPPRLLNETLSRGPAAGHKVEDLPAMLDEYYAACGWDAATGAPTAERLQALGLT